jgi:hypothetical protein
LSSTIFGIINNQKATTNVEIKPEVVPCFSRVGTAQS